MGRVPAITYDAIELPYSQRSFSFIPNFDDLNHTFTFQLQAYQDSVGATNPTGSIDIAINVGIKNNYPQSVTASQDDPVSVMLNWLAPVNGAPGNYVIYRDGEKVTTVSGTTLSFEDRNTDPGIWHLYEIASKNGSTELARSAKGKKLGDGLVTAQVLSTSASSVKGDSLILSAIVNGESITDTAYTNDQGMAYFRNLAYNKDGITYTVRPMGDPNHYDEAAKEVVLDYSIKQNGVGAFINTRSITLKGTVKNQYCVSGCGRDSVDIELYGVSSTGTSNVAFGKTKTDHEGTFSFAIPYIMDEYSSFFMVVDNMSTTTDGRGMDSISYMYLEGSHGTMQNDSTLKVEYSVQELQSKKVHSITIYDTISYPVNLLIAGPGQCNVFDDYEFLVRVKEVNGKFEQRLWTTDDAIELTLPPYKFQVDVLDVNKKDAFSQSVLDYFRSRSLTIDNVTQYKNYLATGNATARDTVYSLRYNERAKLELIGLDPLAQKCSDIYLLDSEADGLADQIQDTVTVRLRPTQVINGVQCQAVGGYILPKFPGGVFRDPITELAKDTIRYNAVAGEWEPIQIKGTTPNMAVPYSQLLEFYYYDDNDNFQGSTSAELVVVGQRSDPSKKDVFVVPKNNNTTLVPLYVLRDPPGDKSSAYIKEKSLYSFNFERKGENGGFVEWTNEFDLDISITTLNLTPKIKLGGADKNTEMRQFSLEFKEGLSTSSSSKISENLEGYLDGPDADIIVGLSVVMQYGIVEILKDSLCQPYKLKQLDVNPNKINSTWVYTRSQIKNTINYYNSLVNDPDGPNGSQTAVPRPGTQFNVTASTTGQSDNTSAADIAASIGYAKDMFTNVLDVVDSKFTPVCEMCTYAHNTSTSSKKDYLEKAEEYLSSVRTFCTNNIYLNNECRPMQDLINVWDQTKRNDYGTAYQKYLMAKEIIHFYDSVGTDANDGNVGLTMYANDDRVTELNDEINDRINAYKTFNPLENITFSAGAKVTKALENSKVSLGTESREITFDLSSGIGIGTKVEAQIGWWQGFGVGAEQSASIHAFKSKYKFKVTPGYSHKSSINTAEYTEQEFKTGFTLNDDDDGDHFSIDVFHSWTDGATKTTPYFNIVGGRSSCPYEEGTIPRDEPKVQFLDENDNLLPTKYYDLNPDAPLLIPVSITSGNQFDEDRLVQITAPLASNKSGINMEMENVRISNYRGSVAYVKADEGSYRSNIVVDRGGNPNFDFTDLKLIAKPNCNMAKGTYWEHPDVFDTLEFEVHFRKPTSPIMIESDMDSWFLIDDENGWDDDINKEALVVKLRDFKVEQNFHALKEIYVEYKKENEEYWTKVPDATTGLFTLSVDTLLAFYHQKLNTYQEPLYPFVWDISNMVDLKDGNYQVRATAVHPKGYFEYSNVLSGKIDRTHPRVIGYPAPSDSLLSLGEDISVSFDEAIDCDSWYQDGQIVLTVKKADGVNDHVLPYNAEYRELSAYELFCDGSSISLIIDPDTLRKYDGKIVEARVTGVKDYLGNVSDPLQIDWAFQVDFFKKTPSPISIISPSTWTINLDMRLDSVELVLSDYDVNRKSYGLDSIAIATRHNVDNDWNVVKWLYYPQLANHFLANQQAGEVALFPTNISFADMEDGDYEVRAELHSGNEIAYSGSFNVLKDTLLPEVSVQPDPVDYILSRGDVASVSFTESIDIDAFKDEWVTVRNISDTLKLVNYRVQINSSGVDVIITEPNMVAHDGDSIEVIVRNITDVVGNPLKGGNASWKFVVDVYKMTPSPISILTPESYIINRANIAESLDVVVEDYDPYQLSYRLDSIALQLRFEHDDKWVTLSNTIETREKLVSDFRATPSSELPLDTLSVDFLSFKEGNHEVRAVVFAGSRRSYSSSIKVLKDTLAPELRGTIEPWDKIFSIGDGIGVSFTEDINIFDNLETMVTVENITDSRKTVFHDVQVTSSGIEVLIGEQYMQVHDGDSIKVTVRGITDLVGNMLEGDSVSWTFVMDVYKKPTGAISIYSPDSWVLNETSVQYAIEVSVTDYDLYGVSAPLDSVALTYKHTNETNWTIAPNSTISQEKLIENYILKQNPGEVPMDTLRIRLEGKQYKEGSYEVKAVLWGDGKASYSGSISVYKDVVAPIVHGIPSPSDSIYSIGDEVSVSFSEDIDCDALMGYQVTVATNEGIDTLENVNFICYSSSALITLDDEELRPYYGFTATTTISNIVDLYGNVTDEISYNFLIDNTSQSTASAKLLDPNDGWVINIENDSIELIFEHYDLFEINSVLDSILVQYRHAREDSWTRYEVITKAQLQSSYDYAEQGYDPEYKFVFSLDTGAVSDGEYLVRGIVYGNGYANHTNYVTGTVDLTPIRLAESLVKMDTAIYKNQIITIDFTEDVDVSSLDTAAIQIYQMVGGASSRSQNATDSFAIDPNYYRVSTDGNTLQVDFNDNFYQEFGGETLKMNVANAQDMNGNNLEGGGGFEFVAMNTEEAGPGVGLSIGGTNLRGLMHPNGFVELKWSNPQEQYYAGYEIQNLAYGIHSDFDRVDYIPSQKAQEYQYFHRPMGNEVVYYRLKQIDYDSNHLYTKVIIINKNGISEVENSVVFPNPSDGKSVSLFLNTDDLEKNIEIRIYDLNGAIMQYFEVPMEKILQYQFTFEMDQPLSSGFYAIVIRQGEHIEHLKLKVDTQ